MGLRSLLRQVVRGRSDLDDRRLEPVRAALEAYRTEIRTLRKELASAHKQISRAEHRVEQLLALRAEDEHASERLERLAPIMDAEEAARHVREAIGRARRVDTPCPHIVVTGLLPAGIYAALLEALPPQVFFAPDTAGLDELRVPPELAPLHVAAVWTFVARLARHDIAPALADALGELMPEPPDPRTASGRVVWGEPGPAPGGIVMPTEPNTAVALVKNGELHLYLPLLAADTAGDVRHRYELVIGPRR